MKQEINNKKMYDRTVAQLKQAIPSQKSYNSKLTMQIMQMQSRIYQERKKKQEMDILLQAQREEIASFRE